MLEVLPKIPIGKVALLGIGTIVILFIIFKTVVDTRIFIETTREADANFLWYAFLIILPAFIFNPLRWFFVLKAYGYDLEFNRAFQAVTAAGAFIFIPGRIGDFLRTYFTKDQIPAAESVGSVIVEKIIDVVVLLLIATVGLIIIQLYFYALVALISSVCVVIGVISVKKIGPKLGLTKIEFVHKVALAVKVPEQPAYLLIASLISAANWVTSILAIYFSFTAFHAVVPFATTIAYIPLTIFAGLIPVSLGGVGIRDTAIIGLFAKYATASQSLAAGISYSLLAYLLFMLVGIPFTIKHFYSEKRTS